MPFDVLRFPDALKYLIIMPPKQGKRGVKAKDCESAKPKEKRAKQVKNSLAGKTKPISKYLLKKKFMPAEPSYSKT